VSITEWTAPDGKQRMRSTGMEGRTLEARAGIENHAIAWSSA
jgi:hypothetical protein